ncbi:MAG: 3-oxoacyl-ACP reductase FabG [Victivallales bacterium]|nr:3-oxoacyl-ACP reductase FabG [Victivallales bacterium]
MSDDFASYNVIVTGGTRGIGRAVTENFLRHGARVAATYAGNTDKAAEFAAQWTGYPLKLYRFDVSDYQQAEQFFAAFDRDFESLQVLVSNAGIRHDGVVAMMPAADWNRVIAVNLSGAFNMSKLAVMRMSRHRFGRIIFTSSASGRLGIAGQANYAASKAGVEALARSLAKEVGKRKITVNCIAPGFIDTELIADLPEELLQEYKNQVPLKRFGTPAEVAGAVEFLASAAASYITGTTLNVTGGL